MAEFGGALDRWLEAPYVEAGKRQDDFENWCDANDDDPDDPAAWDRFDAFLADLEQDVPEPPEDWDRDPRDYVSLEDLAAPDAADRFGVGGFGA